ncbi:MAG: glucose 1-dehydrogenase [Bryobacteraceae bacterium]|nr:glucose 1-dehydrogenase [Bryobacteraceae bacterium]
MRLRNKTALVTGAGNGIGREIAMRFAAEGARIYSLDLDAAGNAGTAKRVRDAGGFSEAIEGDVSSAADVERAFAAAGPVDILVNNAAAWGGDGWLHQVSEESWDRVVAVTLKGVFLASREALKTMMPRREGVIVNISSVNALAGIHLAAYSAAKGGINSLTRVMALQYGPYGIRVNAICPGTIMTESSRRYYDEHREAEAELLALYPAGRFGEPADVAHCAVYLASEEARFFNGSILTLDGAMSAVQRIPSLQPREDL